jgi:hypothetical protein
LLVGVWRAERPRRIRMQDVEGPAWINFPRVQFPRAIQKHRARRNRFHQLFRKSAGVSELRRPDRRIGPLGALRLGRYEGGFSPHRQDNVLAGQRLLDVFGNLGHILFKQ